MAQAEDNLTDGELQSEIELVGDLVVAATSSEGPLTQDEIDRLLGVDPRTARRESVDAVPTRPAISPTSQPTTATESSQESSH